MSKSYYKFKELLRSSENAPILPLTKQHWSEIPCLIRGQNQCLPIWHYILVPHHQFADLQSKQISHLIDWTLFGRIIQYHNQRNEIISMSGWGIEPSQSIQRWFNQYFDNQTIDEKISIDYQSDDIRLCTIQYWTSQDKLGIHQLYSKTNHFHYLKLSYPNNQLSLAYRSGLRNYDRLISINGINIEQNTFDQITNHFHQQFHHSLQLLVCNPSTYHFYKSNHRDIHSNLSTVQHLQSVGDFKDQCQYNQQLHHGTMNKDYFNQDKSFVQQNTNTQIISNDNSELEDLPNELIFDLFNYLKLEELNNSFNNLNQRFIHLLLSINPMSFRFDSNSCLSSIEFYRFKISHLLIDTCNSCYFEQFPNLQSLILCHRHENHLQQIHPHICPNLIHLSCLFKLDFQLPIDLIMNIFSNQFPSLRSVNLGSINKPTIFKSWSQSPSLQFVSIRCTNALIISDILHSCPNLIHFQFHLLSDLNLSIDSSTIFVHSALKRFTLWSDRIELSFDLLDHLLCYIPKIEYFYLQTIIRRISLFQLVQMLINRLDYLQRFCCFIEEFIERNDRCDHLNKIYQMSSCFNRIRCLHEDDQSRIYSTD